MKSIAVVTDSIYKSNRRSNVGDTIRNNLIEVFGNDVAVNNYYIDRLKYGDLINEDIVLVMAGSRAIKVKDYVTNPDKMVLAKRTFLKNSIYPLFAIPENTDVLVVNDDIETVLDSVSSLYNIGVKHVNLIPYEQGKDYRYIRYAVSPSEPELVPDYIEKVLNVGSRVIDIPTMLQIISELGVHTKTIQQNLYNYYQKIFSANESVTENYNDLIRRTEELDYLLDLSHDGILLTDTEGMILVSNKKFAEIFDIKNELLGRKLHEILEEVDITKYYKEEYCDDLINFKKKYINLEKKNIVHYNNEARMYFSFQEVTYIKKLEQNLSQKLRQKGQIARYHFSDIITYSDNVNKVIEKSRKIAATDLTVLITGESGTGKEVLAQAIHNDSGRKNQPFIAINAAAIPENLIESELFGYVGGSFTGALKSGKKGLFELANNGTIFLDEIGDMPNHLQSKLLRVLQERQITPVGSESIIDIDVRIIAATHRNPLQMIEEGGFRKDLFYRLNVFQLELPPLRSRSNDIIPLMHYFTEDRFAFSIEATEILQTYHWPGNIRELHNVANYLSIIEENKQIDVLALPPYILDSVSNLQNHPATTDMANERLIIGEKTDEGLTERVLQTIQTLNHIGKSAGRKHIIMLMQKEGIEIGEGKLKKTLMTLKELEMIAVHKGRTGNIMTIKGERYLEKFKKNIIQDV